MEFEAVSTEVLGRDEIEARGLGGLAAVAAGSEQEPKLICMRYSGRGSGEVLGLVGKAVTFDSGGISIKPSQGMHEMKMDMSGGAAVLEAVAAIAELGLELDIASAIPATENMPSGSATRPGDIITQLNGKTVEVNNTDAEGRLILADALTWCVRELGADRVVDLATLTGAVIVALGSTYAALISNDDELAATVAGGGARGTGELAWRLPLHPEYKKLTKGTVADLTNAATKRKAGTIYAGSFLEEFVDDRPVGAPRHRRHRLGRGSRVRRRGPDRIRGAAAGRARRGTRDRLALGQDVDPDRLVAGGAARAAPRGARPGAGRRAPARPSSPASCAPAPRSPPRRTRPNATRNSAARPRDVPEVRDPEPHHRRDRELDDVRAGCRSRSGRRCAGRRPRPGSRGGRS